ncbi:MAG: hypothetical protein D6714_14130 [Bacteroidetes bacterium]|nr:MAG: hypothetical protein D6714_14130 [Bacteroidota bacterium]
MRRRLPQNSAPWSAGFHFTGGGMRFMRAFIARDLRRPGRRMTRLWQLPRHFGPAFFSLKINLPTRQV